MITTLVTVNGEPGATTTALGLAVTWPRPILLLEHAIGSPILTGFARAQIPHERGLVSVLAAQRDGQIEAALDLVSVELAEGQIRLIPGFTTAEQAWTVDDRLWSALVEPLRAITQEQNIDILVDAGRYGSASFPRALMQHSDHVLMVTRTSLKAVAGAVRTMPALRRDMALESTPRQVIRAVAIGNKQPYSAKRIGQQLNAPIDHVAWDPRGARVFSEGQLSSRRFTRSAYCRSLTALVASLTVDTNQEAPNV